MSAATAGNLIGRRQCVMDVEVFPNFSMIGLRLLDPDQEDRDLTFTSEEGLGGTFEEFRAWYADAGRQYTWITFNGLAFDNHVVATILAGNDDPASLKQLGDRRINSNNGFRRNDRVSVGGELSVDPFSINGGAKAKIGSLKEIACKLDAPSLRALPYAPDRVLSHDEMKEVVAYNAVDLTVAAMIAACQATTINARIAMAREYKSRSLVNAHDAKVAEKVLALRLFGKDGKLKYPPRGQSWNLAARQLAEKFTFRSPALIEMVDRLPEEINFNVETTTAADGSTSKTIAQTEIVDSVKVADVTYNIGSGGLHSVDEPGLFVADERWTFLDLDVDSFYPTLMINHRLAPIHLPAHQFLAEFDLLRQRRLAAKAAGNVDLANGLKVAINSIFGKSKSPYSWLCDPTVSVSTTLLGQLTLLWFIDLLADIDGVVLLSANTDGITIKLRRDLVEWVKGKMSRAAADVNLSLSWEEYRLIARRDVSNYLAVTPDGRVKAKGSYGYDQNDLGRKATNRIVIDAVREFFVNNTPLVDTVLGCSEHQGVY